MQRTIDRLLETIPRGAPGAGEGGSETAGLAQGSFQGIFPGYGHLGSFDMMIEVGKVVQAKDAGDRLGAKAVLTPQHEAEHAALHDAPKNP